jgi:hypothetical protein
MINLTEVANYDTNVSVPQDGVDFDTAASLLAALQALADRHAFWLSESIGGQVYNRTVGGNFACLGTGGFDGLLTAFNGFVSQNAAGNISGGTWTFASSSPVVCAGSLTIANTAALQTPMTCTSTGRVVRQSVVGPNSGATSAASVQAANDYYWGVGLTANQTCQISDVGAADGDVLHFHNESSSFSVTITNPSAVTLQTLIRVAASGDIAGITVKRISGVWTIIDREYVP